eukprot:TRINITY_DN8257_c0_g2_i1.p1 TRINITY_DN8257_c0_g2~~TRINITY_DN8257_c0_g2_i1.p1  ORF type:complete len:181 (+),score=11.54 TRINITY_DN8257_c0_g2_i1:71-613(+)
MDASMRRTLGVAASAARRRSTGPQHRVAPVEVRIPPRTNQHFAINGSFLPAVNGAASGAANGAVHGLMSRLSTSPTESFGHNGLAGLLFRGDTQRPPNAPMLRPCADPALGEDIPDFVLPASLAMNADFDDFGFESEPGPPPPTPVLRYMECGHEPVSPFGLPPCPIDFSEAATSSSGVL